MIESLLPWANKTSIEEPELGAEGFTTGKQGGVKVIGVVQAAVDLMTMCVEILYEGDDIAISLPKETC